MQREREEEKELRRGESVSQEAGKAAQGLRRILLYIAYDGTNYAGFQAQPSGVATIEGEVARAVSEVTGESAAMIGGSRTDAGVHALCNVAVFDTGSRIPGEKFSYALNSRLPEDIRIQRSMEVAADFHPRHQVVEKVYEYRIYNAPFPSPMKRLYTHYSYTPFDVDRMREGGRFLIGEHDFKSFCSVYSQAATTVRTITDVSVEEVPLGGAGGVVAGAERGAAGGVVTGTVQSVADSAGAGQGTAAVGLLPREIVIRVSGYGFLYNMVRIIAGTLMEVGRGAKEPGDIPAILEARERRAAGPTAPPEGLTLCEYRFLESC
ncbi:MAG: tRNA pseudouridine synthase A [Eubacteriales bacterium]|nr:tRNA pseudouridine synthase A [Eubacteriales bacterium]